MFLGYTLAVLAILGSAKVVVALLVLAVPIIDTFWVIVRRLSAGRSPFSPDRGHIHHLLLDLGLSHRSTVLLIYVVCATLGLMSLLRLEHDRGHRVRRRPRRLRRGRVRPCVAARPRPPREP